MKYKLVLTFAILIILYLIISLKNNNTNLPYSYTRDEWTYIAEIMNMPDNKFNPHNIYKTHFWFYTVFGFYAIDYIIGKATGQFIDSNDYAILYKAFPQRIIFIAKSVSTFFGVVTLIFCSYFLLKYFNSFTFPFFVIGLILSDRTFWSLSQIAFLDMMFCCLSLICMFFLYFSIKYNSFKYIYLSALFVGMSVSTKQNGILLFIPLIIAAYICDKKEIFKNCLIIFVIVILTFFITSPYYCINFISSVKGNIVQFNNTSGSFQEFERLNFVNFKGDRAALMYIKYILSQVYYAGIIFFIYGIFFFIKNKKKPEIILLTAAIIFVFPFFIFKFGELRYILPFIIIVYIVSGIGLKQMLDSIFKDIKSLKINYILVCVTLYILYNGYSQNWHLKTGEEPLKIKAQKWVESNIPPGTKIVNDMWPDAPPLQDIENGMYGKYLAYLKKKKLDPQSERFKERTKILSNIPSYTIISMNFPWNYPNDKDLIIKPIQEYYRDGFRYFIITNKFMEYSRIPYAHLEVYRQMLNILNSKAKLLKIFGKENSLYIKIYYLDDI